MWEEKQSDEYVDKQYFESRRGSKRTQRVNDEQQRWEM